MANPHSLTFLHSNSIPGIAYHALRLTTTMTAPSSIAALLHSRHPRDTLGSNLVALLHDIDLITNVYGNIALHSTPPAPSTKCIFSADVPLNIACDAMSTIPPFDNFLCQENSMLLWYYSIFL
jgi:hypothetical protein